MFYFSYIDQYLYIGTLEPHNTLLVKMRGFGIRLINPCHRYDNYLFTKKSVNKLYPLVDLLKIIPTQDILYELPQSGDILINTYDKSNEILVGILLDPRETYRVEWIGSLPHRETGYYEFASRVSNSFNLSSVLRQLANNS